LASNFAQFVFGASFAHEPVRKAASQRLERCQTQRGLKADDRQEQWVGEVY
jgi:hypothetical protein